MVDLSDLLTDPALALRTVVDEHRTASVRWVATSELADPAPFLEGGEVLLTTGLETGQWREEWDPYVRRLVQAGVVALGLGVGFTHAAAPVDLVTACRRHRLHLVEVPHATRFVSISHAVAEQLQRDAEEATRQDLLAQRGLTRAALRDEPEQALVRALGRTAAMAALVAADGTPRAGPYGERVDLYDQQQVDTAIEQMRPQGLRAATSLSVGDRSTLVQPVGVGGRPGGYLVVAFAGRVSDGRRSTLTTAVALLSLVEEHRRAGRDAERRLQRRAVELLVTGDPTSAEALLGAGAEPGKRLPRRAVILRAIGPAAALADGAESSGAGSISGVLDRGAGPGELVVVVRGSRADLVCAALAGLGLHVGVGEPGPPESAPTGYEQAGHALALTSGGDPVVRWSDGARGGVLPLLDEATAAAFSASFLAPLLAESPDLVEVLSAYVGHNGSLLKVAAQLGLHRNTVRSRVERLELLLHRSLQDPQTRSDAWVALSVRSRTPPAPGDQTPGDQTPAAQTPADQTDRV